MQRSMQAQVYLQTPPIFFFGILTQCSLCPKDLQIAVQCQLIYTELAKMSNEQE
jgi:hypothetical protein